MNYENIYKSIIEKRINSKPDGIVERHHIIPRCLGGGDEESNLVHLTPKEHFVCHRLLAMIHGGSLWSAYYLMSHPSSSSARGVRVTSSQYETGRKNYISYLKTKTGTKNPNYGNTYSKESREKISKNRRSYAKRSHPLAINLTKEWIHNNGDIFFGSHFDLADATGLASSKLRKVSNGDNYSYRGWMCPSSGRENMREGENTNTADKNVYRWMSPEGEVFEGTRNYAVTSLGLDRSGVSNLVRGVIKRHKKWSVIL